MSRSLTTLLIVTFGLTGCLKTKVESTAGSSVSASIAVLKVYPSSEGESWTPITLSSRYFIKGLDLTISGTCSRGIASVHVSDGGTAYTEVANCTAEGAFVWTRTFTGAEEGDKTLTVTPYDVDGLPITASALPLNVRIDNTPPVAPVVTSPASDPYQANGNSNTFSITGTAAADVVRISGPNGDISPSSLAWSDNVTLIEGASTDYTYFAYDLAGNQSPAVTPTIEWAPSLDVKIAGPFPGGSVNDSNASGFSLDATVFTGPVYAVDSGGSNFSILTGFNFVTNQVRAD